MKNIKNKDTTNNTNENENKIKIKSNFSQYSLICRVIMSFTSFLVTACILFFVLFIVGNFQKFTDSNQLLILTILAKVSLILVISSIFGIIANLVFLIARVRISHRIISIIVYFLMIFTGSLFIILSTVINKLSLGI